MSIPWAFLGHGTGNSGVLSSLAGCLTAVCAWEGMHFCSTPRERLEGEALDGFSPVHGSSAVRLQGLPEQG